MHHDDPTRIDWPARQAKALIPFTVTASRPINPVEPDHPLLGRGGMKHWGERATVDAALVTTDHTTRRRVLLIDRRDNHGWALPGGGIEAGETPEQAVVRELAEETGLQLFATRLIRLEPRYVPDPRRTREAWTVTIPFLGFLDEPQPVLAGDDARAADWIPADDYRVLVDHLASRSGTVFPAHQPLLTELLSQIRQ